MLRQEQGCAAAGLEGLSAIGLTAAIAVLHVAVLAARVPARSAQHRPMAALLWSAPAVNQRKTPAEACPAPSRRVRTYCAGQLDLTCGMAVVALALWLHIMRTGGVHSH